MAGAEEPGRGRRGGPGACRGHSGFCTETREGWNGGPGGGGVGGERWSCFRHTFKVQGTGSAMAYEGRVVTGDFKPFALSNLKEGFAFTSRGEGRWTGRFWGKRQGLCLTGL